MSTVWASDVGGWDDVQPRRYTQPQHWLDSETEPSSFIDISEKSFSKIQQKYEKEQQNGYNDNIELIKECMMTGVVMPSKTVIPEIINKLKNIASNK